MAKRKARVTLAPHWRPDFRNQATLPDISPVRTGFLLNFIAVTLTLALLVWYGKGLYGGFVLRGNLANLEAQIEARKGQNQRNLQASADFTRQAKGPQEVVSFLYTPLDPADLMLLLAEVAPDNLVLRSCNAQLAVGQDGNKRVPVYVIAFTASLSGKPPEVTKAVNDLKEALVAHPRLQPHLRRQPEMRSLLRDQTLGVFNLQMAVELNVTRP